MANSFRRSEPPVSLVFGYTSHPVARVRVPALEIDQRSRQVLIDRCPFWARGAEINNGGRPQTCATEGAPLTRFAHSSCLQVGFNYAAPFARKLQARFPEIRSYHMDDSMRPWNPMAAVEESGTFHSIQMLYALRFETPGDRMTVVHNIYRALSPGGTFFLAEKTRMSNVLVRALWPPSFCVCAWLPWLVAVFVPGRSTDESARAGEHVSRLQAVPRHHGGCHRAEEGCDCRGAGGHACQVVLRLARAGGLCRH